MAQFAQALGLSGRMAIDETGIAERFDFQVEYAPGGADLSDERTAPSIDSVLGKLGLRLERAKGPPEFLIIDHVEKPRKLIQLPVPRNPARSPGSVLESRRGSLFPTAGGRAFPVALAGGPAGAVLGTGLLRTLAHSGIRTPPRAGEVRVDGMVVLAMLVTAAVVGIVIGLIPSVQVIRARVGEVLREESRSGTGGRRARRVRTCCAGATLLF